MFQLSELGNGVLANLQLQVQSDVVDLEQSHPELAQKLYYLRDQLNRPEYDSDPLKAAQVHDNRRSVANQFDRLLTDIRRLAGFEKFLLALSECEMKQLATFGPIVVFNVSDIWSDAFIITTNDICCIPLPLLRKTDLENSAR